MMTIPTHSSYSEGDHCPLSLSEGPQARTFTAVKGRRPALYFTVSLSDSSKLVFLFVCLTAAFRFRCLHAFWKREPKKKNRTKVESEVRSK